MKTVQHKYARVIDEILGKIECGELTEGSRLPGTRKLADQMGFHYHTVRQAYIKLSNDGYLELKAGSGTFVTGKVRDHLRSRFSAEKIRQSTGHMGVLLPMKQWGYYMTNLIDQLHQSAERQGLTLNIRAVDSIDIQSSSLSKEFQDQGCCAIILPWVGKDQQLVDLHDFVRASELPVVLPDLIHGLENNWYRLPEQRRKGVPNTTVLRGRYFQSLGYENIALLGSYDDSPEHLRCKSIQYMDWVSRENLPNLFELAEEGGQDLDRIIDRWLPMKGRLAVIAYHDDLALEFMDACRKRGLGVPEDFAVMGHRKNQSGLRSDPTLSTMLCSYSHIADGMVSHAQALCCGSSGQLADRDPQSILVRESCGGRRKLGNQVEKLAAALVSELFMQPA
jgi:DNA-binding LacI/PurR family transcriptional regulator